MKYLILFSLILIWGWIIVSSLIKSRPRYRRCWVCDGTGKAGMMCLSCFGRGKVRINLVFLALLFLLAGCMQSEPRYLRGEEYDIYLIDGCQYVGNYRCITHKANCTNQIHKYEQKPM